METPFALVLLIFAPVAIMGIVYRLAHWAAYRSPAIPTPEQAERARLASAQKCLRHNDRIERQAAREAWVEIKPRVAKAIAMGESLRRVEIEHKRHVAYYNGELARRGWVLVQECGPWYRVEPLPPSLPIPAAGRATTDGLPVPGSQQP